MSRRRRLSGVDFDQKPLCFELKPGRSVLGSSHDADLRLRSRKVSRHHAALELDDMEDGHLAVEDLGSHNGVFVNGRKVDRSRLVPGDRIEFGGLEFTYEVLDGADAEPGFLFGPAASKHGDAESLGAFSQHTQDGSVEQLLLTQVVPGAVLRLHRGATQLELAVWIGSALQTAGVRPLAISAGPPWAELYRDDEVSTSQRDVEPPAHRGRSEDDQAETGQEDSGWALEQNLGEVRILCGGPLPISPGLTGPLECLAALLCVAGRSAPAAGGTLARTDAIDDGDAVDGSAPLPLTCSDQVRAVYRQALQIAPARVGVLVLGESGTGKELLVRYLHGHQSRAQGGREVPLVATNCAALPRDLLESELFGIERGVATGVSERPGKFELADEGILFLDEVGDMPLETQAMILRVLQEKEVYRIGGHQPRPARVRIVAATNQPLERLIDEGRFRSDLYYRIAGCVLRLPPLRERPEDITNLAAFFLAREAAKLGKRLAGLSRGAVEALHECSWPGNVRQLESEMARITAMAAPGSLIARSDLSLAVLERSAAGRGRESLEQKVAHLEQQEIHNALVRHSGDVDRAAEELGISRATLYRKKRDRVDE